MVNGALASDAGTFLEEVPISGATAEKLTGVVTMTLDSPEIAGVGTQFGAELRPGDAVKVGAYVYTVTSIDDTSSPAHLYVTPNGRENLTSVEAFRDRMLLRVQNGGGTNKLVVDKSGLVGVGTSFPETQMSFGRSVVDPPCQARQGGYDHNGWCRRDLLALYELAQLQYGFGMHSNTMEVYTPPDMNLQIGARDSDGGFAPNFSFSNAGDGTLRLGLVRTAATSSQWGTPLYFSGATGYPSNGRDSDNSDPLYIVRYNSAVDSTELRVAIGDNPGDSGDAFVVGAMSTNWTPEFYVLANGNYWFGGSLISTRSSKREIVPFKESALDILDKVELVSFAYKEDSKDRPKRVGLIADDAQHPYDPRLTNGGTGFDVNTAAALLIKAVQEQKQLLDQQKRLIDEQRGEIAALRALVCRDRPKEALCR